MDKWVTSRASQNLEPEPKKKFAAKVLVRPSNGVKKLIKSAYHDGENDADDDEKHEEDEQDEEVRRGEELANLHARITQVGNAF